MSRPLFGFVSPPPIGWRCDIKLWYNQNTVRTRPLHKQACRVLGNTGYTDADFYSLKSNAALSSKYVFLEIMKASLRRNK
jgi:hypothetical protein